MLENDSEVSILVSDVADTNGVYPTLSSSTNMPLIQNIQINSIVSNSIGSVGTSRVVVFDGVLINGTIVMATLKGTSIDTLGTLIK
nr:hypothetical protein [Acinetobacter seifertii]